MKPLGREVTETNLGERRKKLAREVERKYHKKRGRKELYTFKEISKKKKRRKI